MIELIHGNCFEHFKNIEDGSVDLVLTDPPYFSTNLHFDNKKNRFDFKVLLLELKRILKPNGVLVSFADFNLLAELRSYKLFKSQYEIIWQKNQMQGFLDVKRKPLKNHELIGIFTEQLKKSTYNPQKFNYQSSRFKIGESTKASNLSGGEHYGKQNKEQSREYIEDGTRYPLSVVFAQNWNGGEALKRRVAKLQGLKGHPTKKPLDLVEYLVKTYSNEGDLIIDPFMGSGTTGLAAKNLNRRFIGCEVFEEYFIIAQNRIENAVIKHDLTTEITNKQTTENKALF